MGSSKQKEASTTVVNQTTTPTPTAEETALNQRNLRVSLATEQPEIQAQLGGLNLVNELLAGRVPGGIYQQLGAGISPEAIGTQATQMALQSMPGMQSLGLTDSGVAAKSIAKNIANNLLFPAQQFNVGAMQNLLNLALSGQAQVQQPILAGNAQLGSQLAGLRSVNTSGTTTSSATRVNPFLTGADIFSGIGTGIGAFGALRKG